MPLSVILLLRCAGGFQDLNRAPMMPLGRRDARPWQKFSPGRDGVFYPLFHGRKISFISCRISASGGTNWGPPLKPPVHSSNIVLRGLREALNWCPHYAGRRASLSDSGCILYIYIYGFILAAVSRLPFLLQLQFSVCCESSKANETSWT